jgi:hypothetical protein
MIAASRLDSLIAHASASYQGAMLSVENWLHWRAVRIRPQGRQAEVQEIRELYERLRAVHYASAFADPGMPHRLAVLMTTEVFRQTGALAHNDALIDHVGKSACELLAAEIFFGFPTIDFAIPLALDECVALRAYLEDKRRFLLTAKPTLEAWSQRFVSVWSKLFAHLPDAMFAANDGTAATNVLTLQRPLALALKDPAAAVQSILNVIAAEGKETRLFRDLIHTIEDNVWTATGVPHEARATTSKSPLLPQHCGEPPDRMAALYLAGTPFAALFTEPLPLRISKAQRFEHCHVIAGTGHGKTQLLQAMMLNDFDDPDRPAVVAIDSQGDMMRTLSRLERFNPAHDDRLIILDPADTDWPLRLNLFDVNRDRLDALPRGEREQLLAGIVELYDYIFGALLGAELTQKQSVVFRFLAQLMLAIPDATIHTLRQLLEDPTPYWSYIEQLPVTARTFLTEHLFVATKRGQKPNDYNATRAQVLRRLYGILSNPTFERLFSHPRNALDMKKALDDGKIILVNTAKDVLKAEASAIFGRYVIALILKSALERAADAKASRRPAFVYIDEAADYFDDTIDTLLIQARKYNVGLTIAHQFLDQLTPALRASVLTNPAIRFAGGLSAKDAASLQDDMRTSSEFILGMQKKSKSSQFACFVRHLTPAALPFDLALGQAEHQEKMQNGDFEKLLSRIRAQVAAPISETMHHATRTASSSGAGTNSKDDPDDFADSY